MNEHETPNPAEIDSLTQALLDAIGPNATYPTPHEIEARRALRRTPAHPNLRHHANNQNRDAQ